MSHSEAEGTERRPARAPGALAWLIERLLPAFRVGQLTIRLPDGTTIRRTGARPGPSGEIVVHRTRAIFRVFATGEPGFVDGFLEGDWSTPDLVALLSVLLENKRPTKARPPAGRLAILRNRLLHRLRSNTRRGSRRNIAAHYDLGNAFYQLWLDRSMNYSSALFRGTEDLETAQAAKMQRIVELLDLRPNHDVLEIGCGWGALAEVIVPQSAAYTGLTLSTGQRDYAIARLGATARGEADIRLQDYRDVTGSFDRIVCIEMFEAVGERYWPVFFDKLRSLLRPNGIAVLQVITIAEDRFETYRRRPDFIQRHIFPGGALPTVGHVAAEAERVGLIVSESQSLGDSYAATLREWHQRFTRNWAAIEPLGFDRRFRRMWEYYLSYCEVGFRHGTIDVHIMKLQEPA